MENLPKIPEADHEYLDSDFTPEEFTLACKTADPYSAASTDNIISKMIQLLLKNEIICNRLLYLFNQIKRINYVPEKWRGSVTSLIHKPGGDPHSVNGYRPISLLSVMYKLTHHY